MLLREFRAELLRQEGVPDGHQDRDAGHPLRQLRHGDDVGECELGLTKKKVTKKRTILKITIFLMMRNILL